MLSSSASFTLVAFSLASAVHSTPLSTSHNNGAAAPRWSLAPLIKDSHPHGSLNDSYIVMFKPESQTLHVDNHLNFLATAHAESAFASDLGAGLRQVYDGHVRGYAGRFAPNTVAAIRAMPEVAYVEHDQIVRTQDIQRSAPWGLARISHRNKLTFGTFRTYEYDADGGEGVDVYVIDTGINVDHVEFQGRAKWGKTMPQNDEDVDGNGHGTHCAGTIASRKYGVAKAANVIAVKVLGSNGSGSMSDVVGGVVWAAQQAAAKMEQAKKDFKATGKSAHKGSVANMSLGGGKSRALDDAVNRAVTSGMHFAVAAGNDNKDACNYSPAAAELAVTVGASTVGDDRAYFSNHGTCVDVLAPGLNILSTWVGGKTATNTISGTSMASPHTAGLLAYLLSIYPSKTFNPEVSKKEESGVAMVSARAAYQATYGMLPDWLASFFPSPSLLGLDGETAPNMGPGSLTPADLKKALLDLSTKGKLSDLPAGTPNLLIFNNATSS
jgi:cerevisin